MKRLLSIVKTDFKVMFKDKMFLFWTVAFPMMFIFIFGNINYGSKGGTLQAALTVINRDQGKWGERIINNLKSESISLQIVEKKPQKFNRILIIPKDFSKNISEQKEQSLQFIKSEKANVKAALQAQIKIIQSIAKIITELIMNPDIKDPDKLTKPFKQIIDLKSSFVQKKGIKIPSGTDHVIPGVLVQFLMMNILIYGGVTIIIDRKKRRLERVLYSPASKLTLWTAKLIQRVILGIFQGAILLGAGKLIFNMNLGNIFYTSLNIIIFSTAISALSLFLGSVIKKEEIIIAIAVLFSNIFAAIAGCWWPIEIVPEFMKKIALINPAFWAMDAFHKIIFFGTDLLTLSLNFLVLFLFALFFCILSIRFFKYRD